MSIQWRIFSIAFAITLLAYGVSFIGHSQAWVGEGAAVGAALIYAALLWKRPDIALTALFSEFAISSFGRLLPVPWPSIVSLRALLIVLTLIVSVSALRDTDVRRTLWQIRWPLIAIAVALGWGVAYGLIRGQPVSAIVGDANGYVTLLLLPAVLLVFRSDARRSMLFSSLLGASAALAALMFALFAFFLIPLIGLDWQDFVYRWVRDVRLGEITPRWGFAGVRRVFLQSQIVAAVILLWVILQKAWKQHGGRIWWAVAALLAAALVIGGSRTFWLAMVASVLVISLRVLLSSERPRFPRLAAILVAVGFLGILLPGILSGGRSFQKTVVRAGDVTESAIESRWNLLRVMGDALRHAPILGYGFGAPLSYRTNDPRLLAELPSGIITTTAFEWGWLEMWFKMGLLGPVAFVWLLAVVFWGAWKEEITPQSLWVLGSIVFLAVAHFFSPWLNHPVGIGLLLLAILIQTTLSQNPASREASQG